jgi:hypothetical protein
MKRVRLFLAAASFASSVACSEQRAAPPSPVAEATHGGGWSAVPSSSQAPVVLAPPPAGARSCDERVIAGAFSNLVSIATVNTAADETAISVTADGAMLFYQSAGTVMTATLSGKTASAPTVLNIAGAPAIIRGGSVNADGSYWFAGDDGAGGATSLFQAKGTLPNFTAIALAQPTTATLQTMCPFTDPIFRDGSSANDLYVTFRLSGCQGLLYVAGGMSNKQIGAFVSAFSQPGLQHATLLPGGLTMLASTTTSTPALAAPIAAIGRGDAPCQMSLVDVRRA